jgi:membrane protein YdbS with pleckstrin-like domain
MISGRLDPVNDALPRLREPANRVSPKARVLWTIDSLFGWLVLTVPLAGAAFWFRDKFTVPWWAWVLWGFFVLAHVLVMPTLRYRTHRWEATAEAIYTQTGWLGRERRIAPMSRVQTVDFEQSAVARAMGLAGVTVTTASAKGPLEITGLAKADAERLVESLTAVLETSRGDAT